MLEGGGLVQMEWYYETVPGPHTISELFRKLTFDTTKNTFSLLKQGEGVFQLYSDYSQRPVSTF